MNLQSIVIDQIIFLIQTKQLNLKHLSILPKILQNKIWNELNIYDKRWHSYTNEKCMAELLYKKCNDCDVEHYHVFQYPFYIITLYFKDSIKCINNYDPSFIYYYQLLCNDNLMISNDI